MRFYQVVVISEGFFYAQGTRDEGIVNGVLDHPLLGIADAQGRPPFQTAECILEIRLPVDFLTLKTVECRTIIVSILAVLCPIYDQLNKHV